MSAPDDSTRPPAPASGSEDATTPSLDLDAVFRDEDDGGDPGGGAPEPPDRPVHEAPAAAGGWSLWQCVLFRFALVYALLYILPLPISTFFGALQGVLSELALAFREPTGALDDPDLAVTLSDVSAWIGEWISSPLAHVDGRAGAFWQWVSTRLGDLFGVEVLHQRTGSGDTAHRYLRVLAIAVTSLLATVTWSLLARGSRGYPRAGRWLHVFVRFYVGYYMLVYGSMKLYAGQFGEPSIARLSNEIGETSPMGMVWTFMGASKPYELFGGVGELVAGLLLFHRRTALLGAVLTVGVMANVCALNWLYDVPVKLFSSHLLLFAVFLTAPWAGRLAALFVSNRSSSPVDMRLVQRRWLGWLLVVVGWTWFAVVAGGMHLGNVRAMQFREQRGHKPALFGRWDVEKMVVDGEELALDDGSRWEFVAFDRGDRAWYRAGGERLGQWTLAEALDEGELRLSRRGDAEPMVWRVEQGTATRKVKNPEPRTMQEYSTEVDATLRTLVLRGQWGDKQLELHTVEHPYPLHRGFHWVQELPFNR